MSRWWIVILVWCWLIPVTVRAAAEGDPFAENFYERLGVSGDASSEDIKKAYRAMMMKYHPDTARNSSALRGLSDQKIKEASQKIGEAYNTLKDPAKRAKVPHPRKAYYNKPSSDPPKAQTKARAPESAPQYQSNNVKEYSLDEINRILRNPSSLSIERGEALQALLKKNHPAAVELMKKILQDTFPYKFHSPNEAPSSVAAKKKIIINALIEMNKTPSANAVLLEMLNGKNIFLREEAYRAISANLTNVDEEIFQTWLAKSTFVENMPLINLRDIRKLALDLQPRSVLRYRNLLALRSIHPKLILLLRESLSGFTDAATNSHLEYALLGDGRSRVSDENRRAFVTIVSEREDAYGRNIYARLRGGSVNVKPATPPRNGGFFGLLKECMVSFAGLAK